MAQLMSVEITGGFIYFVLVGKKVDGWKAILDLSNVGI